MMRRKKTQGVERFEQQVYPPKKEFVFFPFLFSFPAFNNQKCDLVGLKNMNALVS